MRKQPNAGKDTHDSDPTRKIRNIQQSLARSQGGTQFVGVNPDVKNTPHPGTGQGPDLARGDLRDGPSYYTPGEFERRNFGPDDNSTPEGEYGDFAF